jgi:hypothetical protein
MRLTLPVQPDLQKVFRLHTPMHLLSKLHWEIEGFRRSLHNRHTHRWLLPAYHAFNCAVTAWHMTDWIWLYVSPEEQRELAAKHALAPSDLRSFQEAMGKACRALNACRELCNGSKHREVTGKRADRHVRARASWGELTSSRKRAEPRYGMRWEVTDKLGTRPALKVFREAEEYWYVYLAPYREGTFVPSTKSPKRRRKTL